MGDIAARPELQETLFLHCDLLLPVSTVMIGPLCFAH